MRKDSVQIWRDFLEGQPVLFMAGCTVRTVKTAPKLLLGCESSHGAQVAPTVDHKRNARRCEGKPNQRWF